MQSPSIDRGTIPTGSRETDARVGMMIFVASWGMVFGTLFFTAAVLRVNAPEWPPANVPLLPKAARVSAWVNTAAMLLSSALLVGAFRSACAGVTPRAKMLYGGTILLGCIFFSLQGFTWLAASGAGLTIKSGTYGGLFYVLTVFHALHVLAGLCVLVWALPALQIAGDASADKSAATRARIRLRSTATFWHFVDFAWIATFLCVFLI